MIMQTENRCFLNEDSSFIFAKSIKMKGPSLFILACLSEGWSWQRNQNKCAKVLKSSRHLVLIVCTIGWSPLKVFIEAGTPTDMAWGKRHDLILFCCPWNAYQDKNGILGLSWIRQVYPWCAYSRIPFWQIIKHLTGDQKRPFALEWLVSFPVSTGNFNPKDEDMALIHTQQYVQRYGSFVICTRREKSCNEIYTVQNIIEWKLVNRMPPGDQM